MKIGGKYKLREITLREWKKAAIEFQYDETALIERIRVLADSMPDAAAQVHKQLRAGGIRHDVSKRLVSALQERATACLSLVR